jgi:hypothetical protein
MMARYNFNVLLYTIPNAPEGPSVAEINVGQEVKINKGNASSE